MITGVVLMTYGSPRDAADVAPYITRVRGGHLPTDEVLAEFQRRYATIGGSPLVEITGTQARRLQDALAAGGIRVEAGMRFSEPSIDGAVDRLVENGAERLLGLILSPQYSPLLMSGYDSALAAAAERVDKPYRLIRGWHAEPSFIQALAARVRALYEERLASGSGRVHVLLTAHSLPRRVVDREPDYVEQIRETADRVAAAASLPGDAWSFAYQSAGHTPEEWLKPDLLDVLPQLAAAGVTNVVLAPVQFLADHLETLYDVDVAGRRQAIDSGIRWFGRMPAFNNAPDFIVVLATVLRREMGAWDRDAAPTQAWVPA